MINATDMVTTSTGGTRSVTISKGPCYVPGTQNTDQGTYRTFNDAPLVRTHDAAVTFPRLDQLVVRVYDSTELGSGALDYGDIEIVKGTEANGATVINRTGAVPDVSLPANCIRIADVLVPVGASPVIPSANIVDRRPFAGLKPGGATPVGVCIPYCMANEPTDGHWSLADGGLIDKTVYSVFATGASNAYNGGVDPGSNKVRKPDKRGRTSYGADNMGTSAHSGSAGAAGRLTTAASHPNARGQNGGAETVQLAALESGVNPNGLVNIDHAHNSSADMPSFFWAVGGSGAAHFGGAAGTDEALQRAVNTTTTNGGNKALTTRPADSPHNNMPNYEVDLWIVRIA